MANKQRLKHREDDIGKYGFVNGRGKWIIAPQFDFAWDFEDGIALIQQNSKYGYIKEDGTYLLDPQFDYAQDFNNGIAMVRRDDKYGYIKADGTYLSQPQFEDAESIFDGIARVQYNGKYGYIKEDGTYLFEPQFDDACYSGPGIEKVKQNGKYGFIRKDGTYIAKPKFDYADDFHDGKSLVWLENKTYTLTPDGTLEEIDRLKGLVGICDIVQQDNCPHWSFFEEFSYNPSWSFIEASNNDGKWEFKSWARIIDDNRCWDDDRWFIDELRENEGLTRYSDEVAENSGFAEWVASLNLQTPEEVGELLWANAQQLIDSAKIAQKDRRIRDCMKSLTILIQLYWQLKNIEDLGLQEVRKRLDLPIEKKVYLHSQKVKRKTVKLCADLLAKDASFVKLDFLDLVSHSHTPGNYSLILFADDCKDEWFDDDESDEFYD